MAAAVAVVVTVSPAAVTHLPAVTSRVRAPARSVATAVTAAAWRAAARVTVSQGPRSVARLRAVAMAAPRWPMPAGAVPMPAGAVLTPGVTDAGAAATGTAGIGPGGSGAPALPGALR